MDGIIRFYPSKIISMDIEFHYYINYLIAIKAGFNLSQSLKIAYSAQFVDDNTEEILVYDEHNTPYKSMLTQSYSPFLSKGKLTKTHLCFHFIPGEIAEAAALRLDTKQHLLLTTPGSFIAKKTLRHSLTLKNMYSIGIASHAFADTWAHANFAGVCDEINAGNKFFDPLIPNIGHADFFDKPDKINIVWRDDRLSAPEVNNKDKFINAAKALFIEYKNFLSSNENLDKEGLKEFQYDLSEAIGEIGEYGYRERIKNYQYLAAKYSRKHIAKYDKDMWRKSSYLKTTGGYRWKKNYLDSNWYLLAKCEGTLDQPPQN